MGMFVATAIEGGMKKRGMKKAAKYNRHAATVAYNRSKKFRSTAYQVAMKDLKKAGLNPMLAYVQGGAATPNVAQAASVDYESLGDLGNTYRQEVQTNAAAALAQEQTNTAREQGKLNHQKAQGAKFDNARKEAEFEAWNTARDIVTGSNRSAASQKIKDVKQLASTNFANVRAIVQDAAKGYKFPKSRKVSKHYRSGSSGGTSRGSS